MSSTQHLPELESLRSQVAGLARELAERDRAMQTRQQGVDGELQDLRKQADLLRAIMEGTAADTGDDFFASLATHLTSTLHIQYAVIGEVLEKTPASIRTLAVSSGGTLLENFEYDLAAAPCRTGLTESFWCFEQNVQALFPNFPPLAAMGVESHSGVSIRNKQGKVVGLIVVMDTQPIAHQDRLQTLLQVFAPRVAAELQRKHAESALRQKTQRLAHAQALAHLGSWDWDIGTGLLEWSDEQFRIFGHEPGSVAMTHDAFLTALLPEDHDRVLAALNATLVNHAPFDVECRIVRPNGEVRAIHWRGDVARDTAGHPLAMTGTCLDRTERASIEEILALSEERWKLAIAGSHDGIWDWDIRTGAVFFSTRWKAMRGHTDKELANHVDEWRSRIHPDDLDRVLQSIDAYLARRIPEFSAEYRVQRKDGSYIWVLDRGMALWAEDGAPLRMVGSESDITDRKQAEEALRERAGLSTFLAELSLALNGDLSIAQILQQCTDMITRHLDTALARIWTIAPGDLCGECHKAASCSEKTQCLHLTASSGLSTNLHGEYRRVPLGALKIGRIAQGTGAMSTNNVLEDDRLPNKDWMRKNKLRSFAGFPLCIEGNVFGVLAVFARSPLSETALQALESASNGVAATITRKRAEEALRLAKFTVDRAADAVYWIDPCANILEVNEAACAMLGYSKDALCSMTIHDLNPDFQPDVWPGFWAETKQRGTAFIETRHRAKDGRMVPVEIHINYLSCGAREYHCAFVRDITERKRAEEQRDRQHGQLQAVYRMTMALAQARTVEQMYAEAMDGICAALKIARAAILLFDEDGVLRFKTSRGLSEQYRDRVEGHSPWSRDAVDPPAILVSDCEEDPAMEAHRDLFRAEGIRALGFIPLVSSDGLLGKFMLYYDRPRHFVDGEIQVAQTIAGHVAFMIQRKQAEERLQERERRLRFTQFAVDRAADAILWTDDRQRFIYANNTACRSLGYTQEELLGLTIPDIAPLHDPDLFQTRLERLRQGDTIQYESLHRSKNGRECPVEVSLSYVEYDGAGYICGIVRDITERKQMEQMLWTSQQTIRALYDISSAQTQPFEERIQALLHLGCRLFKLPIGALMSVQGEQLEVAQIYAPGTAFHPGMSFALRDTYCGEALQMTGPLCIEHAEASEWSRHPSHVALGIDCYFGTKLEESHQPTGTLCFMSKEPRVEPFTERDKDFLQLMARWLGGEFARRRAEDQQKQLLAELAESQKHFEHIFHWTPSAVAISTLAEGRFLDVNDRLAQLTGYSREELIGHTTAELRLWADPPERARVIQEILQQRSLHNKEGLLRTKSGELRTIMISVDRIQVKATPCLIYVAHDITERKQAEITQARQYEALRAIFRMTVALSRASSLEELYEQGIDGVQRALKVDRASILLFDEDGVMRFKASRGLSEKYKMAVEGHSPWSRETVNPQPMLIQDVGTDPSVAPYREMFVGEGIAALGFIPLVSPEGLLGKFMLYYDTPHQFTEEEIQIAQTIAGHVALMIQRKQAMAMLRHSERQLRTVLDSLPIGVWFTDRTGKTLLANPAAKQIWSNIKQVGLQSQENPAGWWETLEPANEPHRWALGHTLTTGKPSLNGTLDLEGLDGGKKTIRNTTVPVRDESGTVVGAVILNEDLTEIRRVQEALRLTQFSVDHAVEAFLWIGPDAGILTANDAACRMFEYSREELLGMTVHDIDPNFPPESWSTHWNELRQKGTLTIESQQWSKTGRVLDVESTVSYFRYMGREYLCAIMRDIGERKEAQRALCESEDRLQRALEASGAGTWRVDLRTGLDTRDTGLNRLLGLPAETTVQPVDEWFTFLHPDDRSAMEAAWQSASINGLYEVEHRLIRSDGAIRWVYDRGRFVRDEVGQLLYATGAVIDITERKRVEETLRQHERDLRAAIEERERISADLHDGILQSLYAVGLGLEACKSLQQQQSKKAAKAITKALDQAVGQLNAVMGEVRNFIAGLDSDILQSGKFSATLRAMIQMLVANHPMRCHLAIDETAVCRLSTEQALHMMNIVREAISNSLRHGYATKATVSLKPLARSICLTIRDNGEGFEPADAHGLGHGLSNMRARAKKMGGRFSIQSTREHGTRITIDVPKETSHAESESDRGSPAARR